MNIFDQGGPAFPTLMGDSTSLGYHQTSAKEFQFYGMTLRDYFAAKALAAMISKDEKDYPNLGKKGVPILAGYAYEYADAMLKAREGGAA